MILHDFKSQWSCKADARVVVRQNRLRSEDNSVRGLELLWCYFQGHIIEQLEVLKWKTRQRQTGTLEDLLKLKELQVCTQTKKQEAYSHMALFGWATMQILFLNPWNIVCECCFFGIVKHGYQSQLPSFFAVMAHFLQLLSLENVCFRGPSTAHLQIHCIPLASLRASVVSRPTQ